MNTGPHPEFWSWCPAWVPYFWRAREMNGAMSIWEALGIAYSPAMAEVVMSMANALTAAENGAREEFSKDKK